MQPILRKATEEDVSSVKVLYHDAIGLPGCTWNKYYPSQEDIDADLAAEALYVLEYGNGVIGAVSVVPENELDTISSFTAVPGKAAEIARVTVTPDMRNKGYARLMLETLFEELKKSGVSAVRLLVAKCNPSAKALYNSLGFHITGEVFMYGNDYYTAELLFQSI